MRTNLPRVGMTCALAFALSALGTAQTVTVDLALDDFMDFGGAQRVADLPGPDGHVTVREAVTAANNTPGAQTIAFAIPTSEWSIFYSDRALIRLDNMLYVSGDDTTIDFSTQASFTGDTNPLGGEVALQYAGPPAGIPSLWIAANDCTVRGLDVTTGNNAGNGIWLTGNRNRVVGCTTGGLTIRGDFGGGSANVVGGTAPGEGNTFSEGVNVLSRANDNVLVGNTFRWGLRISGDTFWGTCDRNRVGGPTVAERNVLAGHGYYGEEGFPTGTQLEVFHARDTLVQGNFVGTNATGTAEYVGRAGTGGIAVGLGAVGTRVLDNLVSGIVMVGANHYQGVRFGVGIAVVASATDTLLAGNTVGLAIDGLTPIPNVAGILVQSDPNGAPANTRVGDALLGGNHVAGNEQNGVQIGFATEGVELEANSIHDNGALGIDLFGSGGAGVTPNDALDLDQGGNHLQNFPVLTNALRIGHTLLLRGELASEAGRTYRLDFFASPTLDPSGHGEGERFLGSARVTTDAGGRAAFVARPDGLAPTGWFVSATTTDLARGETSEFSRGLRLRALTGVH